MHKFEFNFLTVQTSQIDSLFIKLHLVLLQLIAHC